MISQYACVTANHALVQARSHEPFDVSEVFNQMQQHKQPDSDLPNGLAQPAQRALALAGIFRLEQLATHREAEIKHLHGIGPHALEQLRRALALQGLAFAG